MTRFLSVPLLLLCCAGPPATQPPPHKAEPAPVPAPTGPRLKIDAEVKPAGQYATFVPDTDCKAVTYVGLSGVEPIPSAVLLDARLFLLDTRGLQPGRYQFAAVGAAGDRQVRADFAVVVGVPPPPQPPGPGPQPPGPGPLDPFQKQLTAALATEPDRSALPKVVAYYRAAALTAQSPQYATTAQLWAALTAQAASSGAAGALPGVRAVTQAEVARLWPGPIPADAPLTDAQRAGLRSIFERAAAALGGA